MWLRICIEMLVFATLFGANLGLLSGDKLEGINTKMNFSAPNENMPEELNTKMNLTLLNEEEMEQLNTKMNMSFLNEDEMEERSTKYTYANYNLGANQQLRIHSMYYINPYNLAADNRWVYTVQAPSGYRVQATCYLNLYCNYFRLYLSKSGRFPDTGKTSMHCSNAHNVRETTTMMTDSNVFQARYRFHRDGVRYKSGYDINGYGNFYCDLKAVGSGNNCNCGSHNSGNDRIVNGQETYPHEYPFFAALSYSFPSGGRRVFCGASIISQRWVMTAAHCVDFITPDQTSSYNVVIGTHNIKNPNSNERSVAIETIIAHEAWNSSTVQNDIALINLSSDIHFSDEVSPVCLPMKDIGTILGKSATAMGYGQVENDGATTDVLHDVNLTVESSNDCRKYSDYYRDRVTDNMICTYQSSKDACRGDSGGPLVIKKNSRLYEIGVISWGQGCAQNNQPGVYTMVSHYTDWIKATTGETFCS